MSMQITIIEHITDNRFILKCAYCKGTGRKYADDTIACPICNGRGVILLEIDCELPLVVCAYCKGAGRKYADDTIRCPQCNGSGAQPLVGSARIIG